MLLRQVSPTTLDALLAGRWCHDRSESFAFFFPAMVINVEDRTRSMDPKPNAPVLGVLGKKRLNLALTCE
ncbi:hypothetical protein TNCV_4399691 [Trichonephila clavipes]|nr:hypothetical protein TNCV_4399691 [Trichonephila clavipes]